jgi:hypothetical protein
VVWSLAYILLALRSEEPERAAKWPVYQRRIRTLNLLAVPAWWAVIRALANLYWRSGVPADWKTFDQMFSTHPSLYSRIDAIARVGHVSIGSVARLRQEIDDKAGDFGLPHAAE